MQNKFSIWQAHELSGIFIICASMTVFAYLCPTHFFLFAKLCWIIHKTPQTPFWMGEIKKWVSCAFLSSLLTGVVEVLSGWVVTLVIDYYFCVWCVVGTFFWRTTLTGKADVTTLWVEWFIFLRNVYHQHGAQHSPSLWRPVHFKHWISPSSAVQWSTLSQRSAHHSYVLEALVKDKNNLKGYFSRWTGCAPSPGTRPQVRKWELTFFECMVPILT